MPHYPLILQYVFSKNKDSFLHSHSTIIIRNLAPTQCYLIPESFKFCHLPLGNPWLSLFGLILRLSLTWPMGLLARWPLCPYNISPGSFVISEHYLIIWHNKMFQVYHVFFLPSLGVSYFLLFFQGALVPYSVK